VKHCELHRTTIDAILGCDLHVRIAIGEVIKATNWDGRHLEGERPMAAALQINFALWGMLICASMKLVPVIQTLY
jgi:hypothetical protein